MGQVPIKHARLVVVRADLEARDPVVVHFMAPDVRGLLHAVLHPVEALKLSQVRHAVSDLTCRAGILSVWVLFAVASMLLRLHQVIVNLS